MTHPADLPSRASAAPGAMSREAGLRRVRAVTEGAAVTAALGSVALALALARPADSQAASSAAPTVPKHGAGSVQGTGTVQSKSDRGSDDTGSQAPSSQDDQQQQLAPPAQPPDAVAPQSQPQAASGGS